MGVLPTYESVHYQCTWCLQGPEKGSKSSGNGVTDGYETPCRGWESNTGPLEQQSAILGAKLSPSLHTWLLDLRDETWKSLVCSRVTLALLPFSLSLFLPLSLPSPSLALCQVGQNPEISTLEQVSVGFGLNVLKPQFLCYKTWTQPCGPFTLPVSKGLESKEPGEMATWQRCWCGSLSARLWITGTHINSGHV